MHDTRLSQLRNPVETIRNVPTPDFDTVKFESPIGETQYHPFTPGMSVEEIAMDIRGTTDGMTCEYFGQDGRWHELDRRFWHRFRPKDVKVIKFQYRYHGGDAGRSVFGLVTLIAVSLLVPALTPALGALGANLFAAGVGIGLSVLSNTLFPSAFEAGSGRAAVNKKDQDQASITNLQADTNILALGTYLPYAAGTRRILPPMVMQPHNRLLNGVETVDLCYGWFSEADFDDIEQNGTEITGVTSIESEIKNGSISENTTTFIDEVGKFKSVQQELINFKLNDTDIEDQTTPENSEPVEYFFSTPYHPNMVEMNFQLAISALIRSSDTAGSLSTVAIPFRMSFRKKGDTTWINIAEIHITGREAGNILKDVRFRWDGDFEDDPNQADAPGVITYGKAVNVPTSDSKSGTGFISDAYFRSGSGVTASVNIRGRASGLRITLDEDIFEKASYEWRLQRGMGYRTADFTLSIYEYTGATPANYTPALFESVFYQGRWVAWFGQGDYPGRLTVRQSGIVIDEPPVQKPGTGVLAIRSRQDIRRLSGLLSNRVLPPNLTPGVGTPIKSNRPAPHLLHWFDFWFNEIGLDGAGINRQSFIDWNTECNTRDYQISHVATGQRFEEIIKAYCAAGFARLTWDNGYAVTWLQDRSAEEPIMFFSDRNCSNIEIRKKAITRPSGWKVKFPDETNSYETAEKVFATEFPSTVTGNLALTVNNVSREIDVARRLYVDDLTQEYRPFEIVLPTDIEGNKLHVGALIGVSIDLFGDYNYGFRIMDVLEGGLKVRVDAAVPPIYSQDLYAQTDIYTVDDLYKLGLKSRFFCTSDSGTQTRTIVDVADDVLILDSVLTDTNILGTHCTVAADKDTQFRFVVERVKRKSNGKATVYAVPEANEIYTKMVERFG